MTSLIAFYGKMAELLYEGVTVDFIYLDVRLSTLSPTTFLYPNLDITV